MPRACHELSSIRCDCPVDQCYFRPDGPITRDSRAWTGREEWPPGYWGFTYFKGKFSLFEGGSFPFNIHFNWDSVQKEISLYVCFSWKRGWRFYRHWNYG